MVDEPSILKRQGAFLPHWERLGATYATTMRLADSLPRAAAERLAKEKRQLLRELEQAGALANSGDLTRLHELQTTKMEAILNRCYGACPLRQQEAAEIVIGTLKHFDGVRYVMHAYCVMPNHVHAAFTPHPGFQVQKILGTWKRYSGRRVNALLGKSGEFWQEESYDHLIRNAADFDHAVRYILRNPVAAGLHDWPWVYLAPALRS